MMSSIAASPGCSPLPAEQCHRPASLPGSQGGDDVAEPLEQVIPAACMKAASASSCGALGQPGGAQPGGVQPWQPGPAGQCRVSGLVMLFRCRVACRR